MTVRQRIIPPISVIVGVISFGTIGYAVIEGWTVFDSLYMTIITLTTVGYEEVHPLSRAGRYFTIILVLSGVGSMLYALGVGAKVVIEGEFRDILGRRQLSKKIERLKDHYIICGYGRMGKTICKEMVRSNAPFIIVEKDPEILITIEKDVLSMQGDSTQDSVLKDAGIDRARGLISVISTDADNLYVVLSARGLNPQLKIVARASEDGAEQKLLRAGADKVISPYSLGGLRIAQTILKPAVVDFIEFATKTGNLELQMEEIKVKGKSQIVD